MTLRLRVTLAFTAVLATVLAGAGAFLYVRFGAELRETQERGLRSRAAELQAAVARGGVPARLGDAPGLEADEELAQVVAADGRLLAGSRGARALLLTPGQLARARRGEVLADRPGDASLDERVRLLAVPVGEAAVVVVGSSRDEVDESLSTLLALEALGLGAALLLGAAGAWVLAHVVVRPVRVALQRERRFVADASHELRTPLTVLRAELEVARLEGRGEREALASAEEEVERLSRLAEDLLVLARADDDALALRVEDVDVGALLAVCARRRDGVRVGTTDVRVRADPARLERAVGNLVDNALRHGAPPVLLSARAQRHGVVITVRDHGGGIDTAFAGRALERFSRADDSRGGGGAGLGLAIVDAVARAHGGEVRLTDAAPGLRAELVLPHRSLMREAAQ